MDENNKLLAEFLGHDVHETTNGLVYNPHGSVKQGGMMKYWEPNEDWNQLILVVEKIEEEGRRVDIQLKDCDIYEKQKISACADWNVIMVETSAKTKIEAVYAACVEYIKKKKFDR